MARKIVLISDISGQAADEAAFTKLVVRTHPSIKEPKQLDVLPSELKNVQQVTDLVTFEVGSGTGLKTYTVTLDEFRKLVSDETVESAPGTRGRRAGYSPKS